MPAESQLAFVDVRGGMNAFDPPHRIATNQVARMVNCSLVDGLPTTRLGGRVVPFSGGAASFIAAAPVQGSAFYNPAKGQGGIILSDDNATLALAAGGRKLLVSISGRRGRAQAAAKDVTGGAAGNAQNHLAWLSQWENLLIVADGEDKTFIYDPALGAAFSKGYNTEEKDKSQIPNGGTCLLYAHGRGVAVVSSRIILVGDSLHRTNLTSSANLKEFTEQVYWATGQYFVPPSSMGNILALALLPLKNTQHGHAEIIAHCEDGLFSVDINQFPRENWPNLQLVKHVVLQGGAVGPYAVGIQDGDQIYRTRNGVQTLRSAAATSAREGSPVQTLSPEVDTWFSGDYPRWLRFASVLIWDAERKVLFTTSPIVQGSHRWHRGLVVRNTDAAQTSPDTPAVWEGLWTLPPQMSGVIQTVGGIFDGETRTFAWVRGVDAKNRLVEFAQAFREDILEDGSHRPIRAQVITRAIDAGKWWEVREYTSVRLFLRNIAGRVRWGVWFRPEESPGWKFLRAGEVSVPDVSTDPFDLSAPWERTAAIALGRIPNDCAKDSSGKVNESRSIQFLVRWEGFCSLEGIKVDHGDADLSQMELDTKRLALRFLKAGGDNYSDWEYSETDAPLWITDEK